MMKTLTFLAVIAFSLFSNSFLCAETVIFTIHPEAQLFISGNEVTGDKTRVAQVAPGTHSIVAIVPGYGSGSYNGKLVKSSDGSYIIEDEVDIAAGKVSKINLKIDEIGYYLFEVFQIYEGHLYRKSVENDPLHISFADKAQKLGLPCSEIIVHPDVVKGRNKTCPYEIVFEYCGKTEYRGGNDLDNEKLEVKFYTAGYTLKVTYDENVGQFRGWLE